MSLFLESEGVQDNKIVTKLTENMTSNALDANAFVNNVDCVAEAHANLSNALQLSL